MKRLPTLLMLGISASASAQAMDHSHHVMPAPAAPSSTPPTSWAADSIYPAGKMAQARAAMLAEHGGMSFSQIMVNIAEVGFRKGREGYRWDGEGWFGGDIDRLTVKSEGNGAFGERLDDAEVQALWSHALDAYWNLQAGVRQDFGRGPSPTHLTLGVEGLAPYWFEVEAALFLSNKGDVRGRVEAWYDQRLTQRLILQPRVELNLAAQDVRATGTGAGLSDAEIGLRLRYEIRREFAPYLGISHDRRFGDSTRFARAAGETRHATSVVAGIRFWF